jgi:hypothetical protein
MRELLCVLAAVSVLAAPVGMESTLALQSAERLQVLPVDTEQPLLVRIITETESATGWHYEFGVVGQFPGEFPLADYLVTNDEKPAAISRRVAVSGVLTDDHNGWLDPLAGGAFPKSYHYGRWWLAAWCLWGLGLFLLLRPEKLDQEEACLAAAPSLEEQLMGILDAADLSPNVLQRIEALILQLWRERLGLLEGDPGPVLAALKADPQSGPIIRDLERCLHAPSEWDEQLLDSVVRTSVRQESAA